MPNIIKSFKYSELGSLEKTKSFEISIEDDNTYTLRIKGDKKDYKIASENLSLLFDKYSFKNLTIDSAYPIPIKEQIDYRLEAYFLNPNDNFDLNGYSHYPEFYNEFISDLAKLSGAKSLSKFKVKEEYLDKDNKYKTNYIEKCSVITNVGKILISVDKFDTSNYEVDVNVDKIDQYFKTNDLSFIYPANVSYFTFLFNKLCKFSKNSLKRSTGLEEYIDIRLKNKKHRYFDLHNDEVKSSFITLLDYLKMFIKIPILNAFVNPTFIDEFIVRNKKPKTKAEVAKDYSLLINEENYPILDALKKVAKENQNLAMNELVSIAYSLQDAYFVYIIDEKKNLKEVKILDMDKRGKKLLRYFNPNGRIDMGFIDLSKDYDAHYYIEAGSIHLIIVASRYPELEYLRMNNKLKDLVSAYFNTTK